MNKTCKETTIMLKNLINFFQDVIMCYMQVSVVRNTDANWKASLRGSMSTKLAIPKTTMDGQGVTSLDLSHNAFTDVLIIEISPILRSNAPLVGNLLTSS
jgi:hypothetical protein